ncbi:MAG: hypothetical protein HRT90_09055 [Candidatus Margulisbacteria bacterium]|nr:hypothetical protein [Candidatus Margulisiibacteriota bacterium]
MSKLPIKELNHNQKNIDDISSEISFNLLPYDFIKYWKRCGNISNFLAQFQSFNFNDHKKVANVLSTINTVNKEQANTFQYFMDELLSTDPEELFLSRIMKNADGNSTDSRLGLINLKKDFNADFQIQILPNKDKKHFDIHMKVYVNKQDIEAL